MQDGVARARLQGELGMRHRFYHKDDNNRVDAPLAGYLEFEPGGRIRSLRLVTDRAVYGGGVNGRRPFGVAVAEERARATAIIGGKCSDDGFVDFRYWLISKGQRVYEAGFKDPESLTGVVTEEDRDCQFGSFRYVASNVWQEKASAGA